MSGTRIEGAIAKPVTLGPYTSPVQQANAIVQEAHNQVVLDHVKAHPVTTPDAPPPGRLVTVCVGGTGFAAFLGLTGGACRTYAFNHENELVDSKSTFNLGGSAGAGVFVSAGPGVSVTEGTSNIGDLQGTSTSPHVGLGVGVGAEWTRNQSNVCGKTITSNSVSPFRAKFGMMAAVNFSKTWTPGRERSC